MLEYADNLQSSLLTQSRASPQFAGALQRGAPCMVAVGSRLPELSVILGTESALKVRPPAAAAHVRRHQVPTADHACISGMRVQEMASGDAEGPVPRSRRGRGPPPAAHPAAEKLHVLSLHEPHQLDAKDAREQTATAAGSDPFAGMQLVASKPQWRCPPLPMCARSASRSLHGRAGARRCVRSPNRKGRLAMLCPWRALPWHESHALVKWANASGVSPWNPA